jgi:endoglucanase
MMDFWKTISSRYADNNTVAFYELYNEPITGASYKDYSGVSTTLEDWLVWKDFMEQIIASIRANDPDKIILVGGLQFAYDLSFVANAPITGKNVAFATHPYSHPKWKKDWKTAFGDLSSQYPVFATEFGYDEGGSPDDDYNGIPYHRAIVEYLEDHHISWAVWDFDASWAPTLLLDNFTYQPSPAGEYFRNILLNLNQCH